MERRDNLLPSRAATATGSSLPVLGDAAAGDTPANLTSSSVTVSPPDFLRQVHAAIKRHRPLGTMQSNFPRATRILVSKGEQPKSTSAGPSVTTIPDQRIVSQHRAVPGVSKLSSVASDQKKCYDAVGVVSSSSEESSLTPPSISVTRTNADHQNVGQCYLKKVELDSMVDRKKSSLDVSSSQEGSQNIYSDKNFNEDWLYSVGNVQLTSQTGESCPAAQAANGKERKCQELGRIDAFRVEMKYEGASFSHRSVEEVHNQHHGEPMTRFSAVGSSVTTLSIHSGPTVQSTQAPQNGQSALPTALESSFGVPGHDPPNLHGTATNAGDWNPNKLQVNNLADVPMDRAVSSNAGCLPSQGSCANEQPLSKDQAAPRSNKGEKERRKKNYDPNVFFKVNGKLYQKLGKIGSGGSSEVYKVISAECAIYALKKIKLKGRDYATAYGFCQEIEYLNKLKGKPNIIQLIDCEVTDKSLLQEVSMLQRDGRIKDDHYIYMVLEYGEIDLAHMVSHKWKEANDLHMEIDENWLRFYWQQMLKAVNTIHEERIVHSDLKPANFLLVRGSLKLIDFGIAKAIMNDTTNIQRDAQVGTLNYMSPEAFMCNEQDTGGNIIKCGRPSDIWSLGCILYQMVYGKTPFGDYKTFWAKFKVITDRNHKVIYEPVSNPLLIDIMQRCLAWDRNERWRIPQLLQHPFLVPAVPGNLPPIHNDQCKLLMERVGVHWNNPEVFKLCSELRVVVAKLEKDHHIPSTEMEENIS